MNAAAPHAVGVLRILVASARADARAGVLTCRTWWNESGRGAATTAVLTVPCHLSRGSRSVADSVLAGITEGLVGSSGPSATIGRVDDAEFVVVVPDADADAARRLAETVGRSVTASAGPEYGPERQRLVGAVTVAIGAATGPVTAVAATIWAADNALYAAIHLGDDTGAVPPHTQE